MQREDGVTPRRLRVHLSGGRGAGECAHVETAHGLLARRHRLARGAGHVNPADGILVNPHVGPLTLNEALARHRITRQETSEAYSVGRLEQVDDLLVVELEELRLNAELGRRPPGGGRLLPQRLDPAEQVVHGARQDAHDVAQSAALLRLQPGAHRVRLAASGLLRHGEMN